MKQTLKNADYTYIKCIGNKEHILMDNKTMLKELFFSNKNHASWGIIYKNTHLEYCRHLQTHEYKSL